MTLFGGSDSLIQEDWNKEYWGNNPAAIQFLKSTGLLERPRRVLEIGSGKGYMLRYLVDNGHDAVGIDMDAAAIEECDDDLNIRQAVATDLPFENNSFDIVISLDLFEHVLDTDRHLSEVRRVLRKDGYYLVETPNKWTNFPFECLRFFRKYGIRHTFDFLKPPEHCSLHSYVQLRNRLRKHGFSVKFYDIPVVNDFFRQKLKRFTGNFGLTVLKLVNPDMLPMPLRTNFFVEAQRLEEI